MKSYWWIRQKALIIGLWWQWKKYLNYFLKNGYLVSGICKTDITKNAIEKEYSINVFTNYSILDWENFDVIIVSLPLEKQWKIVKKLAKKYKKSKFFVEIPVTTDIKILKELTKMENISYFMEESWTLLSKLLLKLKNPKIDIEITLNKSDKTDYNAMFVCYTHLLNNFLFVQKLPNLWEIKFNYHDKEDIFYRVSFWPNLVYIFDEKPRLINWKKVYIDNYNFDLNLARLINSDQKELKNSFLKNSEFIATFLGNQSDF